MEENPSDGTPWLGLLMIRADLHRHGLAELPTQVVNG
jgi:hypothetical protein